MPSLSGCQTRIQLSSNGLKFKENNNLNKTLSLENRNFVC